MRETLYIVRRLFHWKSWTYLCYLWHICAFYTIWSLGIFFLVNVYIYFLCMINYETASSLYLCLYWYICTYYIFLLIDMFVYFVQSTHWLHLILGILFYIYPVIRLFYQWIFVTFLFEFICLCILYQCLQQYVCILYTIYSLVGLHIGNLVLYTSLFIMPLLSYSLTCIHNSVLTPPCLNLSFSCHMHWNTYIHSYFLNISYLFLFKKKMFFLNLKAALWFSSSTL